jgi:hypothetical protein
MAIEQPIMAYSQYFTGEDKTLAFTIYASDGVTLQTITGWSLSWMLKADPEDEDSEALITKVTPTEVAITGASTLTVTLADDDIEDLDADTKYHHELKRTDAGLETVLSYGPFQLKQAVHR